MFETVPPKTPTAKAELSPLEVVVRRINDANFPANCRPVNELIVKDSDALDHAAANLLHVFNGFQLIPVKPGTDPSVLASLPVPSLAERQAVGFKRQNGLRLSVESIAMRNGPESFGLSSFHFRHTAKCCAFLHRNPLLAGTLIMSIDKEIVIWFQLSGVGLASIDLPSGRLDRDGTHSLVDRLAGAPLARFINFARPLVVDINALNWDPEDETVILPHLIQAKYGEFFRVGSRGNILPNVKSLAAYFGRANRHLAYSREDMRFWTGAEEKDQWAETSEEDIIQEVRRFLSTGPWPRRFGEMACDPACLERIMKRLKYEMARKVPVSEQRIREFAAARLVRAWGHSMTVPELYESYCRYAGERGWRPMSDTSFQRAIARVLLSSPFNLRKSKSVVRNGENPNAFRCVKEKPLRMHAGV